MGKRNTKTKLWNIALPLPQPPSANQMNIIIPFKPIGDYIKFMHGACFSPCVSTWCKDIDNGVFKTWPGLTSAGVRRFVKVSEAMSKGNLTQ